MQLYIFAVKRIDDTMVRKLTSDELDQMEAILFEWIGRDERFMLTFSEDGSLIWRYTTTSGNGNSTGALRRDQIELLEGALKKVRQGNG